MANRLTQTAQNALNRSMYYAREMGHTYIGSEHILLGLLAEEDGVASRLLQRRGVTMERTRELIADFAGVGSRTDVGPGDMTPRTKHIIESSALEAAQYGQNYIGTEHILLALLDEPDCVGVKLLRQQNVNAPELTADVLDFFRELSGESAPEGAQKGAQGGARQKVSGNLASCPTLQQYGRDLTQLAKDEKIDPIIGRETETERVIQILSRRTKNNPCLIGEPGVGKTAVVEGLAQKIAEGAVPETLAGKSVVTLDISSMIAGAKYRGEFEERMKGVMAEVAKNPNIILFIDEIHTIIGAGAAEGAVDAANIIKPALARGEMQVIGATTIAEYRKHIEKDAALERRFQSVTVGEPTPDEAEQILFGLRDKYEAHHKVKITDEAIRAAVKLSVRYISDRFLPDKAIDLVDEAASRKRIHSFTSPDTVKTAEAECKRIGAEKEAAIRAQEFERAAALRDQEKTAREALERAKNEWELHRGKEQISIGEQDIAEIVTAWTGIPVNKLAEEESEKLLHLDEVLRSRVIGQEEAVSAVARAIRRGRAGLKDPKRPMGSFIFLGPTGVGKTELSKALANALFGDDNAMIRVDMSEYMEKHSVSKLIGSPPGYVGFEEGGQLTEKIRRHPYSVVLFDEIEKAHPDVFNILLQILEDGILTDSQGRRVDFKNTVIIMTSNVGAANILSGGSGSMGFSIGTEEEKETGREEQLRTRVMNSLKETFRPEFLNRVDEIIVFHKLTAENIHAIAELMLNEVRGRIAALGIDITFDPKVIDLVAKEGVDEVYGARPLRREIQRRIEDSFSTELLEHTFSAGDHVEAVLDDAGQIVYRKVDAASDASPHTGTANAPQTDAGTDGKAE